MRFTKKVFFVILICLFFTVNASAGLNEATIVGGFSGNSINAGSHIQGTDTTLGTLTANILFNHFAAVAAKTDNGPTLPASPQANEFFVHTPAGRAILMMYNGSAWLPVISLGSSTLYVDGSNGTDSPDKGYGTGTNAFRTVQYAIDSIPPVNGGNVTVNLSAGAFAENVNILGKTFAGNYTLTINGTWTSVLSGQTATAGFQNISAVRPAYIKKSGAGWTATSVVTNGGKAYICIKDHASSSGDQPGVGANWKTCWVQESVSTLTTGIPAWTTSTSYYQGYQGKMLYIKSSNANKGVYSSRPVIFNNATAIFVEHWNSEDSNLAGTDGYGIPDSSAVFDVYDWGTTVSGDSDNNGAADIGYPIDIRPAQSNVTIQNIKIKLPASAGIYLEGMNAGINIRRCCITGSSYYGIYSQQSNFNVYASYITQNTNHAGVWANNCSIFLISNCYMANVKYGLHVSSSASGSVQAARTAYATTSGVEVYRGGTLVANRRCSIVNSVKGVYEYDGGRTSGVGSNSVSTQVWTSGNTTDFDLSELKKSKQPDSSNAVAHVLDSQALSTAGAKLISIRNNGTEKFGVDKDGKPVVTQTAATATAGAQTLPSNPAGFFIINVGGNDYKVPYYGN